MPKKLKIHLTLILLVLSLGLIQHVDAKSNPNIKNKTKIAWHVSPTGSDSNTGTSRKAAFATIQKAVDLAQPGDRIQLAPGEYFQDVRSKRDGTLENPIVISGTHASIVKGGGKSRIFEINHDHLVLKNFTIDGLHGDAESEEGYRNKLIYAIGIEPYNGVTGLRILGMNLMNAGGECVRLRYFAVKNEIAYNTITNCGIYDFKFEDGGKNGEGVYIGTAPEQLKDGKNPTTDFDQSTQNWIHHNQIDTQGNECVDIKERALENIVEYNTCTGQQDPESGGMDSRGDKNIFRYNTIYNNRGAGVRLGGDGESDGIENQVHSNEIYENEAGGIKIQRNPQADICENVMYSNAKGDSVGTYGDEYEPTEICNF